MSCQDSLRTVRPILRFDEWNEFLRQKVVVRHGARKSVVRASARCAPDADQNRIDAFAFKDAPQVFESPAGRIDGVSVQGIDDGICLGAPAIGRGEIDG